MIEQPELPSKMTLIRTEPIQPRSTARIESLLDAAAAIIDAEGIDTLTTSAVAARSGSSVGVVYRYFPNIQSLLRALAVRNLEQYTDRVFAALVADSREWRTALDAAIDTFIDMYRTVPGFRALRFGDVINDRFLDPTLSNNGVLALAFAGILGEKYGFEPTDELVFELEVLVEIEDALMQRAFLMERSGDDRFIQKARDVARDYLAQHTTLPADR
ncbi:MAG TPA: TetR family transcriptional regulator [Glaciihabitans sp.]|jgi:AcrR family transcriptional regulator|nr:TetR family transcriptional regulator [Glaciihabitans sp.]